jgi:hypothetical protein
MNSWFPRLRADDVVASGNAGIWLTPLSGTPRQVSPVGTGPIWAGQTLVYNRNDNTTQVGALVLPTAYNDYVGADTAQWAGFAGGAVGHVDRYRIESSDTPVCRLVESIPAACAPRFYGPSFGYLAPYQSINRSLVVDGVVAATGVITDWTVDRGGAFYLYNVAVGTYGHRLYTQLHQDVTIRPALDEVPLVPFLGLDGYPWMLSNAPTAGTFVRMIYSAFGYVIPGELYNPDARIIGDRLHVVGSLSNGAPRDVWIDFTAPKQDLRLL